MKNIVLTGVFFALFSAGFCQDNREIETVFVRPVEIDDVLINPGIGFTTFQRFNGDTLNYGRGWTEGLPIVYQEFDGDLSNIGYPQTSIAYFRVNWRFLETAPGVYNWQMIDKALRTAASRGQTLMLRISPYEAGEEKDVPDWYRKMVGPDTLSGSGKHWRVDPEDPRYDQYFGGMIRAMGERYDGHPDLEHVDISFIGYWGEGSGTHLLRPETRKALVFAYLDYFKKTHLIFQPLNGDAPDPGVLVKGLPIAAYWPDGRNNGVGPEMRHLGWRIDCLGDLGFSLWPGGANHMTDIYPQDIVRSGMSEAWKKAPIAMEICGTFSSWKEKHKYDKEDVKYIIEQGLKWHMSTFNAKSSAVPQDWRPLIDDWLKKMGYRYVLRKLTFPERVKPGERIAFTTWWENKGVAPIYKDYKFAIRLRKSDKTQVLVTDADLLTWLPGDVVYDDKVFLPQDVPEGKYELEIAIVSPHTFEPAVKLAISGINKEGWYHMGNILVQR